MSRPFSVPTGPAGGGTGGGSPSSVAGSGALEEAREDSRGGALLAVAGRHVERPGWAEMAVGSRALGTVVGESSRRGWGGNIGAPRASSPAGMGISDKVRAMPRGLVSWSRTAAVSGREMPPPPWIIGAPGSSSIPARPRGMSSVCRDLVLIRLPRRRAASLTPPLAGNQSTWTRWQEWVATRLATRIFDSIQVHVEAVHVRYEVGRAGLVRGSRGRSGTRRV